MNALILAAGLGTRLGELTADRPKALVEVAGRTMLEHQLRHLSAAGFDHFVINIHHFAVAMREFLKSHDNFGLDIRLSDETDLLLDTGGGIRKAMRLFNDDLPVLVHNVDIFSCTDLRGLYEGHIESGADATLLTAERNTSRYLYFDADGMLRGWSNEKTGQIRSPYPGFDKTQFRPRAFQGIHVLSRTLLPLLDEVPGQKFSITDFYVDNAARLKLRSVVSDANNWVDAGKPETLVEAARVVESWIELKKDIMQTFNAKQVKDQVVQWIRDWFEENGKGCNAVIGISGGKDSSVVAALCAEALGKDRVIGVTMPNGVQKDISDSMLLINHLGIRYCNVNIGDTYNALMAAVKEQLGTLDKEVSNQTIINMPPRLRMTTLYAISQSMNGRVANTCNLSEDWVGYSTRYGDAAGDFSPLGGLTVAEVIAIGKELGLPTELVEKTPSDGLCGKSDEDNLGFKYAVLDRYIRTGQCDDPKIKALIDDKHVKNLFKLKPIPHFEYM